MKHIPVNLFKVLLLIIGVGCGGAAMPTLEPVEPTTVLATAPLPTQTDMPNNSLPPQTYNLRDVAITLARTRCYGPCPVYRVTIRGDGTVQYEGEQFVRVTGTQTKTISQETVIELLREFYRLDFVALRDEYAMQRDIAVAPDGTVAERELYAEDIPWTNISLRLGDYEKRVNANFGRPEAVAQLAEKIDAAADIAEWIKGQ